MRVAARRPHTSSQGDLAGAIAAVARGGRRGRGRTRRGSRGSPHSSYCRRRWLTRVTRVRPEPPPRGPSSPPRNSAMSTSVLSTSSSMIAHLAAGDVALASEAAEAAWSHMRRPSWDSVSSTARWIAQAALARGDLTGGSTRSRRCHRGEQSGWNLATALTTRARVAIAEGDPERAEQDAHDALACSAAVGAYLGVPDLLEILAGLAGDAGSHREAARLFGAADGHPRAHGRGALRRSTKPDTRRR